MEWISILQLTSLAAVVTAAITLTHLTKRLLADVPYASRVPVWLYTAAIAGVLTWVAREVTGTLQGQTGVLIVDGMINGALASGVLEWARAAGKPLAQSQAAREASFEAELSRRMRGWVLPLLLVGGLAAGAAGCASSPALVTMTPTAEQTQATRAKSIEIAKAVESVAHLVTEAGRATDAAYRAGLVPRSVADGVDRAIVALEPRAHALIDIAATVTSDPQLRSTLTALMAIIDDLLVQLSAGNEAMRALSTSMCTALTVASTYLGKRDYVTCFVGVLAGGA